MDKNMYPSKDNNNQNDWTQPCPQYPEMPKPGPYPWPGCGYGMGHGYAPNYMPCPNTGMQYMNPMIYPMMHPYCYICYPIMPPMMPMGMPYMDNDRNAE